jgi:hypothetical protein
MTVAARARLTKNVQSASRKLMARLRPRLRQNHAATNPTMKGMRMRLGQMTTSRGSLSPPGNSEIP